MVKIGLTGGIGTGKSAVSTILKQRNVPIIDADLVAKELTQTDSPVFVQLKTQFPAVMMPDGRLDRKKLRKIIFQDAEKRRDLESILHPQIRRIILAESEKITTPYCIIVIPLLIESQMYDVVDMVVVVDCDEQKQIERAIKRDNCDRNEVLDIMHSQANRAERLKQADYIIHNDKDLDTLKQEVLKLHSIWLDISN